MAEDTIRIEKKVSIRILNGTIKNGELAIQSKNILFPFAHQNSMFRFLSVPLISVSKLKFKQCSIGVYGENIPYSFENTFSKNLEFDSCRLNYLNLVKHSGKIDIINSWVTTLAIDSSFNLNLRLIGSRDFTFGVIQNSKNLNLDIQSTDFKDSAEIRIFASSIKRFDFGASAKSGLSILFQNDTLSGSFGSYLVFEDSFFTNLENHYPHNNIFHFYNSYIDADFIFFQEIPNASFIFEKCSFGPSVYLGDIWASKVKFINCLNIPTQVPTGLNSRNSKILVSFINTDVDQLRMNFTPNMRLVFDSGYNNDVIHNSYERLLTKFKAEGKPDSYRYVDLQYREYKDDGIWGFLEKHWWYYGYRKYYVWRWTFGLLVAFFLFNTWQWKQMHETYPVVPEYPIKKKKSYIGKAFLIFLFTIFVFFSLRLDLEKLKFDRLLYVFFFFFQYAIGLWCLFFILRAVLKF